MCGKYRRIHFYLKTCYYTIQSNKILSIKLNTVIFKTPFYGRALYNTTLGYSIRKYIASTHNYNIRFAHPYLRYIAQKYTCEYQNGINLRVFYLKTESLRCYNVPFFATNHTLRAIITRSYHIFFLSSPKIKIIIKNNDAESSRLAHVSFGNIWKNNC